MSQHTHLSAAANQTMTPQQTAEALAVGLVFRMLDERWKKCVTARQFDRPKCLQLIDGIHNPDATNDTGNSLLQIAIMAGEKEVVEKLIARGASVNPPKNHPLLTAAWHQETAIVKFLLEKGADPNCQAPVTADNNGNMRLGGETPLIAAAWKAHEEITKILLAHGADPDITDGDGLKAHARAMQHPSPLGLFLALEKATEEKNQRAYAREEKEMIDRIDTAFHSGVPRAIVVDPLPQIKKAPFRPKGTAP